MGLCCCCCRRCRCSFPTPEKDVPSLEFGGRNSALRKEEEEAMPDIQSRRTTTVIAAVTDLPGRNQSHKDSSPVYIFFPFCLPSQMTQSQITFPDRLARMHKRQKK